MAPTLVPLINEFLKVGLMTAVHDESQMSSGQGPRRTRLPRPRTPTTRDRLVFRGGFDRHPLAIARVANAGYRSRHALARAAALPLSVRSGGHSRPDKAPMTAAW